MNKLFVGLALGYVLGSVLSLSAGESPYDLTHQDQQDYNTRNQIQFYEFQQRPSTAVPFDPYIPSRPCY